MSTESSGTFFFWRVLQSSPDHSSLDWPTRNPPTAMNPQHPFQHPAAAGLPEIGPKDPFVKVVKALLPYFVHEISMPSTFDQLRTAAAGHKIRALVDHLVLSVTNPGLINALLTLKWHFSTIEAGGINETRANACEMLQCFAYTNCPNKALRW